MVTPVDLGTTRQENYEDSEACHTSFDNLHFLEFVPYIALKFAENSIFIKKEGLFELEKVKNAFSNGSKHTKKIIFR